MTQTISNNETLTPQQEANLAELDNMLKFAFEEFETDDWCAGEEEIENACYLRYYIDGCGIYISEQGYLFFDDALPIENFIMNIIEDSQLLKPEAQMPNHISQQLQFLQSLNKRYKHRFFTVVCANDNGKLITVCSEKHQNSYWRLRSDVFENLTSELISTIENENPYSSLCEPVMGI